MPIKNTRSRYGWISMGLHWLMALVVIAMFALGIWMRELSYYDPWYQDAPAIHKSIGIILFTLLIGRIIWRNINIRPLDDPALKRWERITSHLAHFALYGLMLALMVAGYLISTADGRPIQVFDWFSVPATLYGIAEQEDIAGEIHEILAWALILLAGVHALAALKHHFINRDSTLLKMLGRDAKNITPVHSTEKENGL
ncbi:Cytochrome b561 [Zhongshania aliphaticivorans]|uniref:Cytochrome b561 n=1 Tax=Zhongshania aliphaticivorans TaxID=1470434 RepID=A0A5S9PPK5_9GAMM|nr:cytochrome b [Zhongshania aliphaticivorans]CAA0105893.1 Cytochrome b561 [Zhongshania aliphaticivorans]CAA0106062.1 Cytochrome b561 [Zhongshania aliphaticivorans]